MEIERTSYDEVAYISGVREASHPDRLATIGRLMGLATADPEQCRVLELACGDGGNLIPMAVSLPGSEFVGIDLASTAIDRARLAADTIGLTNVTFIHGDLAEVGEELGAFDYIVAHGVYSWVPEAVRERLLEVVRQRMKPAGVGFVSYNAQPGTHVRQILRSMLLRHTDGITDPAKKVEQARALMALLAMAEGDAGDVFRPILQSEIGRAMQYSDWALFHDDLAEISEPFFFSDFIDAAGRHGLQFLAEATFHDMSLEGLPDPVANVLSGLGQRDRLAKEQYLDYVKCRSFRQTLLCHEELTPSTAVGTETLRQFRFASEARRSDDAAEPGVVAFGHQNASVLRTDNAPAIAVLDYLGTRFPRSVPFPELVRIGGDSGPNAEDEIAEILFRAFGAGVVEMRLSEPAAVFELSERPIASPWARFRAATTGRVVNLYHDTLQVDEASRALLVLLDGSRTLPELAAELGWDESRVREEATDLARHGVLIG